MKIYNIKESTDYSDNSDVKKVAICAADDLTFDTYYFKKDQVLRYHKHPEGDQIFVIQEGTGTFYIDDGEEKSAQVGPGSVVIAPKDTWHKLVPDDGEMVASQATKAGAGIVWKES